MVKSAINEAVNPAFHELRMFLETEYFPATRDEIGVGSLPDGKEFYQACLRWHLSNNETVDDVHQRGLNEVSRLRALMQGVMNRLNFSGTLTEFFTYLRENKSFYHTSKEDLLTEYKEIVEKRINPRLKLLFHTLPVIDCDIRAMPFDGPGGQYNPPADDASRPGVFHVNLMHPTTIPRFGMAVLTLHEVNPGHHMQLSHALQQRIPEFRKKMDYRNLHAAPLLFPTYTAYCEGWALYAEDLGIEMDVYDKSYEMFGKLSEEMFRACRLVVDTGLHCLGWTKDKAVDYMMNNCMMPVNEIENEVCRYITWPGQACAYKIGQLKMKELRMLAEEELGTQFDIRDFHEVILDMSSVPLHLLEEHVNNWIKLRKKE